MYIKIVTLVLATFLGGCVVSPAATPRYDYNSGEYTLRVAPGEPYRADALMEWAKGLPDGAQHTRSANVRMDNGIINYSTSESASSSVRPGIPVQAQRHGGIVRCTTIEGALVCDRPLDTAQQPNKKGGKQ